MQFNILDQSVDYSFINKGALFLESNSLQDFTIGLEIDGHISRRGAVKSASYFVRKKFIDSSSKLIATQIMGYRCSKMYHFLSLKLSRRHAKILKRRIFS